MSFDHLYHQDKLKFVSSNIDKLRENLIGIIYGELSFSFWPCLN